MARTRCDRTPAWAQLQAAYAAMLDHADQQLAGTGFQLGC